LERKLTKVAAVALANKTASIVSVLRHAHSTDKGRGMGSRHVPIRPRVRRLARDDTATEFERWQTTTDRRCVAAITLAPMAGRLADLALSMRSAQSQLNYPNPDHGVTQLVHDQL
jgi:hypothetical protein